LSGGNHQHGPPERHIPGHKAPSNARWKPIFRTGASFGACGEGYLRFSYATSLANIAEALRRVEAAVRELVRV
jgi:bifunctional pyridoxal-dependent enzyme with beta-cystathionase and maltose regulon repressor activities